MKKRIISAVAALAVVIGGFGAYKYFAPEDVASVILLDVNPSIEIQVDDDAEVIRVIPLNKDAKAVLEDMYLEDTNVTTAVNAIIGSLLKHGYMDELANSILVSIEDGNSERGDKLKEELTKEINAILGSTKLNASVLVQSMKNADVDDLADEYDISGGKAFLIQSIIDVNNAYKAEELAELSINELNLILSNPKNEAVEIETTGQANEKAYIGVEAAKEIAFADAKVEAEHVRDVEVEFDYEYGKLIYEVDFAYEEYEYDYSIDAVEGSVVHFHKELDDDYVKPAEKVENESVEKVEDEAAEVKPEETKTEEKVVEEVTDIGKVKAKKIALEHAGLKESEVTNLKVERDTDDGTVEYQVEFRVGNKEYEYEISAKTGKILDYSVDVEDDVKEVTTNEVKEEETVVEEEKVVEEVTDIGKEKAKQIALEHAGLKESEVTNLKVERDTDDGTVEYQVEFRVGNKEYEYEISAKTGKILDYSVDVEDDVKEVTTNEEKEEETVVEEVTDIGKEKAKQIALEHAGLKESEVTNLRVERDTDDGTVEYQVEFLVGNKEYEYEISAKTGKILDYSVDVEDDVEEVTTNEEKEEETVVEEVTDIGKEKAKQIALEHAGLEESKVTKLSVERDVDDGVIEYEVEFISGNKEYSYEINGVSGKILDCEVEIDD